VKYKVLIVSAGLGTRLGDFSKNLNKGLVSVDNKPVISHVIDKFPDDVEFVIATGYKGKLLREYVTMAHPNRKTTFVDVEKFTGIGSGLGHTILCCKEHLQCPFVFCTNDTLVLEEIPAPSFNWMGYADVEEKQHYRTISITDSKVGRISEKQSIGFFDEAAYIGLCGINDYEKFWKHMTEGVRYGSVQIGESFGLKKLLLDKQEIHAQEFTWFDTGNLKSLQKTRKYFLSKDAPEILDKPNEAIWFVNNRVIKYSSDEEFIKNRVARGQMLSSYTPNIIDKSSNYYSYKMINGKTVSKVVNPVIFDQLLSWLERFWNPKNLEKQKYKQFTSSCHRFYKDKSVARVNSYFNKQGTIDQVEKINGTRIPPVFTLFEKINWKHLSNGLPVRFHGDLHFENILLAESGEFVMLDWRQDFAGMLDYGDIYYDLGKLLHGLIVNHEMVNKNNFSVHAEGDVVRFDILRKNSLVDCEKRLERFVKSKGLDYSKVEIIASLIFLNIAALHHKPYDEFLFYLGKSMLYDNFLKTGETL
jgi:NDP-sugar pyrophosphorylase family protein